MLQVEAVRAFASSATDAGTRANRALRDLSHGKISIADMAEIEFLLLLACINGLLLAKGVAATLIDAHNQVLKASFDSFISNPADPRRDQIAVVQGVAALAETAQVIRLTVPKGDNQYRTLESRVHESVPHALIQKAASTFANLKQKGH